MTPGALVGHFRVIRLLGQGGMGAVYEAEDERLERRVALKVLAASLTSEPGQGARARREAEAAGRLKHPGIVGVHEVLELPGGSLAIAFELVRGGSLMDRLRGGPLPWPEACRIGAEVADALAAVHGAMLVHRDVKPHNVMLDADGRARLTDFGLVRIVDQATRLTRTGELAGTMAYMAPEQANASPSVGPAADIYALGATLFHAITGHPPFSGTGWGVVYQHLETPPPPLSGEVEVPVGLDALVTRMLAKAPTARGSAAAVAAALRELCAADRPRPAPRRSSRGPIVVAAVALLVAAAAVAYAVTGRPPLPPRLEVDEPRDGALVGPVIHVEGRADGVDRVSVLDRSTPVGPDHRFSLDVPRPAGDPCRLVIRATGEGLPPPPVTRTLTPIATWFLDLKPDERPSLPLPPQLAFGERAGEYVNTKDASVLVFVPVTPRFRMGLPTEVHGPPLPGQEVCSHPIHDVKLGAYFIGKYEVTREQYARFEAANPRREPGADRGQVIEVGGPDWTFRAQATWREPTAGLELPDALPARAWMTDPRAPVTQVTWSDAGAYCAWAGLTLPTEAQWERAALWDARADEARVFPWGNDRPTGLEANLRDARFARDWKGVKTYPFDDGYTLVAPVGSYPAGASPVGALDMLGNVAEWVLDCYPPESRYSASPAVDPCVRGSRTQFGLYRGLSFAYDNDWTFGAIRDIAAGDRSKIARFDLGFRVALVPAR